MPIRIFTFFIFVSIALLAGCSSSRSTTVPVDEPAGYPNHSISQIERLLDQYPYELRSYEAEAALSLRSPIRSGSFSAEVRHNKDDSLLLAISPGLGIVVVRALVTSDSFFVHDRINKELTVGALRDLQRLLPLPVTPDALYASMLGLLQPDPATPWELSATNGYYQLKDQSGRTSFLIDPAFWRVVRYEERSATGDLVEERTFSDFESFEGIYLPRRLTFRRPGDETAASLYYRKLSINPTDMNIDFKVGSSVPRISFR